MDLEEGWFEGKENVVVVVVEDKGWEVDRRKDIRMKKGLVG